jgi:hypothetical protein
MIRFIDARKLLPTHPTKEFERREVEEILGGVIHHTAGDDTPHNTAAYHVGPNHISSTGCPGLCYSFYITKSADIHWANDIESITWSQSSNRKYLAIVCGGDFSKESPTFAQVFALLSLWAHLTGKSRSPIIPDELYSILHCSINAIYGHHNFGKPACPGIVLETLVDGFRSRLNKFSTDSDWQSALNKAGATLVVDGIWGPLSKEALLEFQEKTENLVADGVRGPLSEASLIKATS